MGKSNWNDSRVPYDPNDYGLLDDETEAYAKELLIRFPILQGQLYRAEFGPGNPHHAFSTQKWFGIVFEITSPTGMKAYTTEGDGYCPYDLVLEDETEFDYFNEHQFEKGILVFLEKLFSDQLVAYRSYVGQSEVTTGLKDISLPGRDSSRYYNSCSGCLFPWTINKTKLRHELRSWNGSRDGVIETMGYW